ncbi:sce7726 family protein [Microvirga thermotolerans]|uniref:Sce7726 family protein n=1 Tax=Microvirga thermotolerans TaxID=2651334 RepID=A0A5P9JRT0_9HYPH|nr:sce7726 family protein [Microvirga thermotolerans]
MIREPHIKAAIIDTLLANRMVDDDSVIVSEMPVASWSRRADLVVANGKLVAFEIKSDADRTERLASQVEAYWSVMEGVTVICAPRHAHTVLESMPSFVGVFIAEAGENNVEIELARKPHIRPLSPDAALRLMVVRDLHQMLRHYYGAPPSSDDRSTLERLARELPTPVLRANALAAVKRRYRKCYEDFLSVRQNLGSTIEALPSLRRPSWNSGLAKPSLVKIGSALASSDPSVTPVGKEAERLEIPRIPHVLPRLIR